MTKTTVTTAEFAQHLRTLADLYDAEPDLPVPAYPVRITAQNDNARCAYLALRRLFPDAPVEATPDSSFVHIAVDLGSTFGFNFWKGEIGEKRTVIREVEEYVFPEPAAAATP